MKKMGIIKLVAVLFLFTMVPFFAYAQDDSPTWNVRRWEYHYFKEWRTEGDTVYGKVQEENIEFFYVSPIRKIALDGREYIFVGHEPMAFPMDSRSYRKEMTMSGPKRLRRSYSIGIRREDGRVYTNRDDFLYYQSYYYDNGYVSSPWLLSFSNPNYQPYHLTDDGSEVILYDYTMEVGDSYRHVDGYEDIIVTEKDTVAFLDQIPRRRLTLSNGLVLIEGLGCTNSNGMLIDYLNPAENRQDYYTYLDVATDAGQSATFYDHDSAGVYVADLNDLVVNGISHVSSPKPVSTIDLQGRRLTGIPARGLYIRDGKKMVAREK